MKPRITARHFSLNESLRTAVQERFEKLEKYYDGITDAHVVLAVNRARPGEKSAEVVLTVYRQTLSASDIGPTHEKALDECIEGLRRQLVRYKGKLRSRARDYYR
ncbi:MAG: ribosome-associated translation inhibitor RaiA [Rhodothermales bacterium]|nr:ribosome-associated translation inhibitor RaiA [Rhodothermales bacterium]